MKQRIPALLSPGDTIGLSATARFATKEMVETAKKYIEAAGYKCYYHPSILSQQGQVAGSRGERINSFNHLVHHSEVKAIWNIRGGYGSAEIVDAVDWTALIREPKWLIGFSDFTTFLCHAFQKGLVALHAPMPVSFDSTFEADLKKVFAVLETGKFEQQLTAEGSKSDFSGTLIGGNLSVIYSIYGTPSLPSLSGCVLILEDLDEYHYHLDRMLLALKRKGAFKGLKGVLLGTFSDIHDHSTKWGDRLDYTLHKHFKDSGIPIALNLPLGHTERNVPLITGIRVDVRNGKLSGNLSTN